MCSAKVEKIQTFQDPWKISGNRFYARCTINKVTLDLIPPLSTYLQLLDFILINLIPSLDFIPRSEMIHSIVERKALKNISWIEKNIGYGISWKIPFHWDTACAWLVLGHLFGSAYDGYSNLYVSSLEFCGYGCLIVHLKRSTTKSWPP